MRDLTAPEKEVIPDDKVVLFDGFIYIISCNEKEWEGTPDFSIDVKILNCEYDPYITLADIEKEYPNVHKVIYEDCLRGSIFNFKNHSCDKNAEKWERVGTLVGYA